MREGLAQLPPDEKPKETKPKVPLLKQKRVIIGLIVGVIVLVVIILVIVNAVIARNRRPVAPDITPLPTAGSTVNHPIKAKIDQVQAELETYEDNQSTLVLPAVDYQISIDPIQK